VQSVQPAVDRALCCFLPITLKYRVHILLAACVIVQTAVVRVKLKPSNGIIAYPKSSTELKKSMKQAERKRMVMCLDRDKDSYTDTYINR